MLIILPMFPILEKLITKSHYLIMDPYNAGHAMIIAAGVIDHHIINLIQAGS